MNKNIKGVLLALLVVLIGLQFIRPARNNGKAEATTDIRHHVGVPDSVMNLLKKACYDCHSNHTNYPWYMEISPVSLFMADHIRDGKAELNFTEFSQYSRRRMNSKLRSVAEQVEEREMPLKSYVWLHPEAKLTKEEIRLISRWAKAAQKELKQKP